MVKIDPKIQHLNANPNPNDGGFEECARYGIMRWKEHLDFIESDMSEQGDLVVQTAIVFAVKITDEFFVAVETQDYAGLDDKLRGGKNFGGLYINTNLPPAFHKQLMEYLPKFLPFGERNSVRGEDKQVVRFFKEALDGIIQYRSDIENELKISF